MKKMNIPSVECRTFEEVLETDGVIVYTNIGFSMMPLLRQKKDIIEIRKKGADRCKKYDVVLYCRAERYILHRILKVLPDGYLIAGDNCTVIERDIKDEDILGVMTRVLRNGKTITPENKWYKVYVHLWCDAYPIRMILLKTQRKTRSMLSKIKHLIIKDHLDNPEQNAGNYTENDE